MEEAIKSRQFSATFLFLTYLQKSACNLHFCLFSYLICMTRICICILSPTSVSPVFEESPAFEIKSAAISAFSFELENADMSRGNITVLMIMMMMMMMMMVVVIVIVVQFAISFWKTDNVLVRNCVDHDHDDGYMTMMMMMSGMMMMMMAMTCMCCGSTNCQYSWS